MNKTIISLSILFSVLVLQNQTLNARSSSIHKKGPLLKEQTKKMGSDAPSDLVATQSQTVKNQTFRNIRLTGHNASLNFLNIKALGKTTVNGPIKEGRNGVFNILNVTGTVNAQNITAKQLNITGNTTFQNLHVDGVSTIKGSINIQNATLNTLYAYSDNIKLKNVNCDNLIVLRPSNGKDPVVQLLGNTNISHIEFKDVKGTIKKQPDVKIPDSVEGATIEKTA